MKKFKTLFFVKSSLITLYIALTLPIPFISGEDARNLAIFAFLFGFILIINITNDYVLTCEEKISYKTSFISNILGKKSWEIFWKDIKLIKTFPTSQGGKVYYFISFKNESFLMPQRIENLKEFVLLVSQKTNLEVNKISYISPLWTYQILTCLSIFMIIGEMVSLYI